MAASLVIGLQEVGDNPPPFLPLPLINSFSETIFPVWLRNRLISVGLQPVLSHSEKSCIVSYYMQFYMNKKYKITILKPVLLVPRCRGYGLL